MGAVECRCVADADAAGEHNEDNVFETLVVINVYDLNEELRAANHFANDVLQIGGAFHAGIEIHGHEWSYGEDGVMCTEPRRHEVHVYRKSIFIGTTTKTQQQVETYMQDVMTIRWDGDDYDLLRRNCCSFVDEACRHLTGQPLPSWINRLARIASATQFDPESLSNLGRSVSTPQASLAREECQELCGHSPQTKDSSGREDYQKPFHRTQTTGDMVNGDELFGRRCGLQRAGSDDSISVTTASSSHCSSLVYQDLAEP